ncbi:Disintegrin and metalloproteinase domain-containing protein 8, partial [Acipenser ruthenus]
RILLGKDYTETYYLQNGTEITSSPNVEEHCFYQGHIQGVKDSSVSINTCSGIRGLLMAEQKVYLIEPLNGAAEGAHAVYRQEHLRLKRATCRDSNETVYDYGPKLAGIFKTPIWKSAPLAKGNRFVEMFLVVDNREYTKYNKDMQEMRSRMLEVVNHVDKLYRPVNVRVVLVGLEVWTYRDKFVVSTDPDKTLSSFLAWRKTDLIKKKKHDNAQFVTGISFEGSTVGLATKFAMCSGDSGAVNEDHNRNPIGVASTIAHEMGHNLGMSHDDSDCICEASKSRKGCIMADSIGNIYPHSFSSCSQQALQQFLSQYNPSCLLNTPNTDDLYGGPVCGNDFVERGEECDCGTVEECRNPCCNATTCRLKEGAQCAHGECCHDCKVKPAGDVCRHSVSDCDLPEYCTGLSPQCPENAFQMNGSPCKFGQGYCFNGECPTHQQHCITLWGPVQCKIAEMSNDADSEDLGLVPSGTKCEERKVCYNGRCQDLDIYETEDCSAKCNNHGVCNHKKECHCDAGWSPPYCDVKLSELPKGGKAIITGVTVAVVVLILAAIITGGLMFCRKEKSGLSNPLFQRGGNKGSPRVGIPKISRPIFLESSSAPQLCTPLCVTVIPSRPPPQPPKAVEQSPMKYNTTSGQVCYNGRCQDLDIYETEDCSAKCNNHGVCNHKKECHCDAGWSPPYCDVKLSELPKGGKAIITGVTVAVVVLILAAIITGGLMFCRFSRKENYPSKTKVFSKFNFHVPEETVKKIILSTNGVIETVLCTLRDRIEEKRAGKPLTQIPQGQLQDLGYYSITDQKPSEEYVQISKQSNIQMQKQEEWKYTQRDRPGHNINQHAHLDPSVRLLMEEKDQALLALHETVEILQMKVHRLEHLVQLKDLRIEDLTKHLEKYKSRPYIK